MRAFARKVSAGIQAYTISRDTGQYHPVVRLMPRKSAQTRKLRKLTKNTLWALHFGGFRAQHFSGFWALHFGAEKPQS